VSDVEQKLIDFLTKGADNIARIELAHASSSTTLRSGHVLREWIRDRAPEMFEESKIPTLVASMIDTAAEAADRMPAGKHRFVIRCLVHRVDPMMLGMRPGEFPFQLVGGAGFSDEEMVAIDMILTDLDQHGRIARRDELSKLVTSAERRDDITMFAQMLRNYRSKIERVT